MKTLIDVVKENVGESCYIVFKSVSKENVEFGEGVVEDAVIHFDDNMVPYIIYKVVDSKGNAHHYHEKFIRFDFKSAVDLLKEKL